MMRIARLSPLVPMDWALSYAGASPDANGNDPAFYTFGYYGNGVTRGMVDSRLGSQHSLTWSTVTRLRPACNKPAVTVTRCG